MVRLFRVSYLIAASCLLALACQFSKQANAQSTDANAKLRILVFGAHPDDAEFKAAGSAIQWARLGHKVKLVSVTNGDIGHWQIAGGPLAQRRKAEVELAAKMMGTEAQVLDLHDGELLPTLENRKTITRIIREWKADVVIAHRPWDYHPDHRYVGVLVQDAAFMVTVPFFCPDVPFLTKNPVFLYSSDRFEKPYPFRADIAVSIDDVFDTKLDAVHALASQVYEGGASGSEEFMRDVPPERDTAARKVWLRNKWEARQSGEAKRYRNTLKKWYGNDSGDAVKFAEAFEICEYGRQPSDEEIRALFPFLPKR
ncbi:MAG: PIG-L family deacetylase [Pirellula sp.]